MKRRSARPFMVEVKQTRTARTSQNAVQPRIRSDKSLWQDNLWQGLVADEVKPSPLPSIQAAPLPAKAPDAPARRVLPSLMPMFEAPSEPAAEAEADPVPRVRRPRGRPARAAVAAPAPVESPAVEAAATTSPPRVTAPVLPAAEAPAHANPPGPDQGPPARLTWRRNGDLRLGERWKRRLPQFKR